LSLGRIDGIGLGTATQEFLAIGFKRTQDARSNYVLERATAVAQEQYKSLLTEPIVSPEEGFNHTNLGQEGRHDVKKPGS
jgi:hypothetical protein